MAEIVGAAATANPADLSFGGPVLGSDEAYYYVALTADSESLQWRTASDPVAGPFADAGASYTPAAGTTIKSYWLAPDLSNPDLIHVAVHMGDEVRYNSFDLGTSTWGTDEQIDATITAGNEPVVPSVRMAVRSNGEVAVLFASAPFDHPSAGITENLQGSRLVSGSWTFDEVSSQTDQFPGYVGSIATDDAGRVYYYFISGGGAIRAVVLTAADVLGSPVTLSGSVQEFRAGAAYQTGTTMEAQFVHSTGPRLRVVSHDVSDSASGAGTGVVSDATPLAASYSAAFSPSDLFGYFVWVDQVTGDVLRDTSNRDTDVLVVSSTALRTSTNVIEVPSTGRRVLSVAYFESATGWTYAEEVLEAGTPPGTGEVVWCWPGAATDDGVTVAVRLDAAFADVRIRYTTDPNFVTGIVETPGQATGDAEVAKVVIAGLNPDTKYFYRPFAVSGEDATKEGAFRTLPSGAASFTVVQVGDLDTSANPSALQDVIAHDPLLCLFTGDLHYQDPGPGATPTLSNYHGFYDVQFAESNVGEFFRNVCVDYVWDDHDYGGNDSDGTFAFKDNAQNAYRDVVPHYPLAVPPDANPIYHSFVVGRVRFVILDCRSERDPKGDTDDATKTMLGATQKQWLKDEISAAKAGGQIVCLLAGAVPWISPVTAGADDWGGYSTERTEISDFIQTEEMEDSICHIFGDMHALAADDGTNNIYSTDGLGTGAPAYCGTPIAQEQSNKGGPYTHGPHLANLAQHGRLSVLDTGGATISLTFSMRRQVTGTDTEIDSIVSILTVPSTASIAGAVDDGAAAGETVTARVIRRAIVSEDAAAGETVTARVIRRAIVSEGASAGDALATAVIYRTNIAGGARADDGLTVDGAGVKQATIGENGKAGEAMSARQVHRASVSAAAKAADVLAVRWQLSADIVEMVQAGAVLSGDFPGMGEVVAALKVYQAVSGPVRLKDAVRGNTKVGGT